MIKRLRWLRWLLLPLGLIHLIVVRFRNSAYDKGLFQSRKLPVPVISIGNVQAGGTGKTPITFFLIRALQKQGLRVGLLSRGYGRQSSDTLIFVRGGKLEPTPATAGDEPMELWETIVNGGMGIGSNRFEAGTALLESCKLDCLLLDDGMQHRKLQRDIEICAIDVSRWSAHPFLLPFSYLRDSKSRLADASVLLLSKWEQQPEGLSLIQKDLTRYANADANIQKMSYNLQLPKTLNGKNLEKSLEQVGVFTGIANPEHFTLSLRNAGYEVVFERHFPDHHSFNLNELETAVREASGKKVNALLVTKKDAVKIHPLLQGKAELAEKFAVVAVEVTPEDPKAFIEVVLSVIKGQKSTTM